MIILWSLLLGVFLGVPAVYYLYMRRFSRRDWNLQRDLSYSPSVTVIVPMHNEEKTIRFKLENLMKVEYPKDKLQIIVVNDSSEDQSVPIVTDFQKSNGQMNIDLIDNKGQRGKTQSLNLALQHADGEVIVVSDADCFWSPQALLNGIEFLSDPSVGAVTGLELLLNPKETWVTETEILYNDVVHTMRIGESKFYSTIIFQGGFGAYKKPLIEQFDVEADDSGTALSIVQKGERTLLVPEVTYFTMSPRTLKGKVTTKLRRASNLVRIWLRCLNLFVRAKIVLPKRIFLPEAYLHIFNPFVFLLLVAVTFLVLFEIPLFSLLLVAFLVVALLFGKLRTMTVELIQDQLFLLGAIFSLTLKQETRLWTTEEAPRDLLKRETLEAKGLV